MSALFYLNIVLFSVYFYKKFRRLFLFDVYVFVWSISFFSFEVAPYFLNETLSKDSMYAYYSFFLTLTSMLILQEYFRLPKFAVLIKGVVPRSTFSSYSFLNSLFVILLVASISAILVRYLSGNLVLGVQSEVNGSGWIGLTKYVFLVLGFNHTGYWNYTGLLGVSVAIAIRYKNIRHLIFSCLFLVSVSFITTQKSYFLFVLFAIGIYICLRKGSVRARWLKIAILLLPVPFLILILNGVRLSVMNSNVQVFDYFSLDTAIWYLALRIDFGMSTEYLVANQLQPISEYIRNLVVSPLFFMPQSFLFGEEIYALKLAKIVSFSNNEDVGITVTPYGQIYSLVGPVGSIILASCVSIALSKYQRTIEKRDTGVISIVTFFYLMPFFYSNFFSQALHESLFLLFRSFASFNLLILIAVIIHRVTSSKK